jgi:hypothetical protein
MRIYINMKQAGSRRNVLAARLYEIPEGLSSLKELLDVLVRNEVQAYRERQGKDEVLQILGAEELQAQAQSGKVAFGRIYNGRNIDEEKAVNNAWQAYLDGIVRVFQNDTEINEETELAVNEGDTFTLIRLTFLSGRM